MTQRNIVTIACVAVAIAALSFVVGESHGQRSIVRSLRIQIDDAQAMLLVDRIVEERRIKSLLARGCANKAIGEITNNENADLRTLSKFVDGSLDKPTIEYITNRNPRLLEELKALDGKYVNTWSAVDCN
jgi:hypothetical protein